MTTTPTAQLAKDCGCHYLATNVTETSWWWSAPPAAPIRRAIVYCPTHAAAPAMRALLKQLLYPHPEVDCTDDSRGTCMLHHENHKAQVERRARALLATLEETP